MKTFGSKWHKGKATPYDLMQMNIKTPNTPAASASRHTPEPWALEVTSTIVQVPDFDPAPCLAIVLKRGAHRVFVSFVPTGGDGEASAARLVSCVNAFAGLNPDALPELIEIVRELTKQKTSLAERARAALAKLKGTK